MTANDSDRLIRPVIGGETAATVNIMGRAQTSEATDGDRDLVDALARDHPVDHPHRLLVAWIAAGALQPNASVTSEADPRQEK